MPKTRGTRRTNKSQNPDALLQSDNEVVEIQPKGSAPTMAKLREDYKLLKEENRLLKEENRLLKEERDFLREKALNPVKIGPSTTSKGSHKRMLKDSSDSSASDSETESSSSEGGKRKKKKTIKKTRTAFGKRVQNPEDVVHRYRAVLKEFRRTRSMGLSCEVLNVDRNTIALTAIIAEIFIGAEGEDFGQLPVFIEGDTVGNYAKTCKAFLEGNQLLGEKIKKMKKNSELLPIKYKFRK
ncbi:unnamed protein product [Boreogadus saida]